MFGLSSLIYDTAPLASFCRADLTIATFFTNDLGSFTPCFIDLALLGVAHAIAIVSFCVHLSRSFSPSCTRYNLTKGAKAAQVFQIIAAALCAIIPLLQLNGRLGQAASDPDSGPAPHEFAAAGLACISWSLLTVLLGLEVQGRYLLAGRWAVRFSIVLNTSAELAKLRVLLGIMEPGYFFYLYLSYVSLQLFLALMALCWWPSALGQMEISFDGYMPLSRGPLIVHPVSSPEDKAGFVSALTFSWLTPLLSAGYKATLTRHQVPELPLRDKVDHATVEFERNWRAELDGRVPASLGRACWRTVRHLFITALPLKLLNDAAQFTAPVFLSKLLSVIGDKDSSQSEGYKWAALMFTSSMVGLLADHQHFHLVMRAGLRLNGILGAQVQAKVLRLTPGARSAFSSGRIFSLVSSDAETLSALCMNVFGVISSPLRIAVALYLLYCQLGISCVVAVACLLLMIPTNVLMMKLTGAALKAALTHTDERTKLEGELVGGIEVVKCSAWELPFLGRVMQARIKELAAFWRVNVLNTGIVFVLFSVPTIIPVATFAAYLLLGHSLSSTQAFVSLALFNLLRFPLFMLPMLLQQLTTARVSLGRLQDFLMAEALEEVPPLPAAAPGEVAVSLSGDFTWDSKGLASLIDVSIDVQAGQLVVIIGSTGSGKTTVLSAMLGQMQQMYGPAPCIKGRVAYVPQQAFIVNGTVRDNILFGLSYDAAHYEQCISISCLDSDLRMLAGGDQTELGDKGINLSGGQRQRVSIARALYSRADVFIMDDPLSALDSKVGRRVFEQAIRNTLQKTGKTVVLATNQLYFVQSADLVIFMSEGRVAESGPYPKLMAAGAQFATMMKEVQIQEDEEKTPITAPNGEVARNTTTETAVESDKAAPGAKLTSEETSAQGTISAAVAAAFINAMGGPLWYIWLLFGYILVEALRVSTTVWLSFWTGQTDSSAHQGNDDDKAMFYLSIYAAISGIQMLAMLGNILENYRLCLRAADKLHKGLLGSLLAAPMSFFHTTPVGRIINRLTKDTAEIDQQLGGNMGMAIRCFLQLVSSIVLMGSVAPLLLPPLVVIMLGFCLLFIYYQVTSRQVKRLEAVSRSPVLSSLTEAISGCATIRAFGSGPRLVQRHEQLVNASLSNVHAGNCLVRWLGVRLETLGALATLLSAVVAVEQRRGASDAGLVLSYAMQLTILMSITMRQSSILENNLNSVERVCEYSKLPEEGTPQDGSAQAIVKAKPPSGWPALGEVEFKHVAMRYRPGLPLVLRGVSFKAASKEKVGIVGRTGAGKSSMIGCLFRLTEVDGGSIEIDGINIAKLPLARLRSSMALIPQVPVLFTGNIRINLSPLGLHNDAELWNALRRARLAAIVESWPAGLDTLLQEGGAPLSAGQRQLLALARAQLNPSRILVLDEATANVDVETDAVIQRTMRAEFKDRTILAIAHRLHTVIDYDKVLVLDKGLVAEFGTPKDLLAAPKGIFTSMVDDTGEATARFLKGVAAGKLDLAESISEVAAAGMEKLCTPAPLGFADSVAKQMLQPGAVPVQVMQGLADQLLERSLAITKMLKEATGSLKSDVSEDDDAELEAEGLLERIPSHGLTTAQRSLLAALEVQLQVQQYAEAALAAARAQERTTQRLRLTSGIADGSGSGSGETLELPANLAALLLRSHSSSTRPPSFLQKLPGGEPVKPGNGSLSSIKMFEDGGGGREDIVGVLRACQKKAVSRSSHSGHEMGMSPDCYSEEATGEARRAAGVVRASSMRQQVSK